MRHQQQLPEVVVARPGGHSCCCCRITRRQQQPLCQVATAIDPRGRSITAVRMHLLLLSRDPATTATAPGGSSSMAWPSLTAVATGPCSCCRRAKLLQPPGEVAEAAGPCCCCSWAKLLQPDQPVAPGPCSCARPCRRTNLLLPPEPVNKAQTAMFRR